MNRAKKPLRRRAAPISISLGPGIGLGQRFTHSTAAAMLSTSHSQKPATSSSVAAEDFTGWTVGAGVERRLGNTAIRGELRYTGYGSTKRVVPYDDLGITVPLLLRPDGVSVLVSVIRHF